MPHTTFEVHEYSEAVQDTFLFGGDTFLFGQGFYTCTSVPAGRPLTEPPILDYARFVEDNRHAIPSDARLKRLFAKNIPLGYKWRDEATERKLLGLYEKWSGCMSKIASDAKKRAFYSALEEDLQTDLRESGQECDTLDYALKSGAVSSLGYWEYGELDEDGGTKALQKELEVLTDANEAARFLQKTWATALEDWDPKEVFDKYGHLLPPATYSELKEWYAIPQKVRPIRPSDLRQTWTARMDAHTDAMLSKSETTMYAEPAPAVTANTILTRSTSQNADKLPPEEEMEALRRRVAELESSNHAREQAKNEQAAAQRRCRPM